MVSGVLFLIVLIARPDGAARASRAPIASAWPCIRRATIPVALNGFGLWLALMIGLTIVNYGFPIAQLMALTRHRVPAVYVGAAR